MSHSFFKPVAAVLAASMLLAGCQSGPFAKQPVPEPRYIPKIELGDVQTLTILPAKVSCDSALPMLCMVAQQETGEQFQIPYSWIEGFNHANGVQYQVRVRPEIDMNTQQMTGHWVLQSVVSQQAAR